MKSFASVLSTALAAIILASCGSSEAPQPAAGRPVRTGNGNADLQGPTADDVIWQSTRQWHADRRHDRYDRRRW